MLVCALGARSRRGFRSSSGGWKAPRRRKKRRERRAEPGRGSRTSAATADAEGDGAPYLESLESESLESESLASVPSAGRRASRRERRWRCREASTTRPPGPFPSAAFSSGTRACYRLAAFATFAVTLAVFPAVTSSVCAAENGATSPPCLARASGSESRFAGDPWTPSLFLLFNALDLAGRGRPLPAAAATRAERTGGARLGARAFRARAAARVQRGDVAALAFPGLVQTLGRGARVFRRRARLHERSPGERERDVGPDARRAGARRKARALSRSHRGRGSGRSRRTRSWRRCNSRATLARRNELKRVVTFPFEKRFP